MQTTGLTRERIPWNVPLLIVGGLAGFWVLLIFFDGFAPGWAGDTYLEVARDLLGGTWWNDVGLNDPDIKSATYFAPGYPLLIAAAAKATGADPFTVTEVLMPLSWLALLRGVQVLYRDTGGRPGLYEWLTLGFVATSPQVVWLSWQVWPEPLYLAACVWAIVAVERYALRPVAALAVAVVLLPASVVWLRYAGIGLAGACALRLLLEPSWTWRQRIGRAVLPGIGLVGLLLWLVAQLDAGNGSAPTTVDNREFALNDIWNSVGSLGSHVVGGVFYNENQALLFRAVDPVLRIACVAAAVGLTAMVATAVWRRRTISGGTGLVGAVDVLRRRRLLTVTIYCIGSAAFLSVWRFRTGYMILPRYWTPLVVPAVASGLAVQSRGNIGGPTAQRLTRWAVIAIVAACAVMTLAHMALRLR